MIYIFVNIEEIKNTLREFQAENDWKIKNTQADFKKVVSYKKKKSVCLKIRVFTIGNLFFNLVIHFFRYWDLQNVFSFSHIFQTNVNAFVTLASLNVNTELTPVSFKLNISYSFESKKRRMDVIAAKSTVFTSVLIWTPFECITGSHSTIYRYQLPRFP